MELVLANLYYVAYRLIISGPIVKLLTARLSYYLAVFIMAQLSFFYDTVIFNYYFQASEFPEIVDYILADIVYTLRVLVAWWLIKQIWNLVKNYWIAVFIGAEITFVCDYFIFKGVFL